MRTVNDARASKRRKLDTPTPTKENIKPRTASTQKAQTPQTASKRTTVGRDGEPAGHASSPAPTSSARIKTASLNEAAADEPEPQSALEKLKARRAAQSRLQASGSSPVSAALNGSPSKLRNTEGFFKQFAGSAKNKLSNGAGTQNEGVKADDVQKPAQGVHDRKEEEDGEHAREPAPRSSARAKRVASSGMSSAVRENKQKGKTFEDEIRELEEAARREVEAGDGETATPTRRASNRNSASVQTTPKPAVAVSGRKRTPAKAKPTPKPEVERVDSQEDELPTVEANGDAMEVDQSSADDKEAAPATVTHSAPAMTVSRPTPGKLKPPLTATATGNAELYPEQIQLLQYMTLERIAGTKPTPLTNLHEEYAKVDTVISQTITAGESNSMLLIGARGSAKTALMDQILREQTEKHPDEFHVVRLNGFIHTDDKIALREIWRQLGREMELDEDESTSRNYADTLATLLALLSHPAELGQEQAPGQSTKSVIFLLDEFELFATHPRQTLLYNLFDIAQSRKAPIAVLGLTTRIDVAEALEKRVKSRFSHRYVHLSLARNVSAFLETCKAALCFHASHLSDAEKLVFGVTSDLSTKLAKSTSKSTPAALETWNSAIDTFLATEEINAFLLRTYYTTKSIPAVLSALYIPLASLPSTATNSAAITSYLSTSFSFSGALTPPDSKLSILPALSTLQLALLICAARQTAIHNTDAVSFNLAYEEYKVLASKAKIQAAASGALGGGGRVWGKGVARGAWEGLMDVALVMDGGRVDVGLEEIGESGVELGGWGRWCREI